MKAGINLAEWVDVGEMFPDKPRLGEPVEVLGEDGITRTYTREKDGSVTYSISNQEAGR